MQEKNRIPRAVVLVSTVVFLLCAYDLYDVALQTGNFRGMWVSLLHMAIVAVGACVALREQALPRSATKD
jgi:hypothetical protein